MQTHPTALTNISKIKAFSERTGWCGKNNTFVYIFVFVGRHGIDRDLFEARKKDILKTRENVPLDFR